MIDDSELAEELRDRDLASSETLERARFIQGECGKTLYQILIDSNMIDEDLLVEVASEILNVASVDLNALRPDSEAVEMVPRSIALRNQALPLETETDEGTERLVLAMSDPIDMLAMDEVASHTGIDIRPVLAGPRKLQSTLLAVYGEHEDSEAEALDEFFNSCIGNLEDADPEREADSLSGFGGNDGDEVPLGDSPDETDGRAEPSPHEKETLPRPSKDESPHDKETVPRPMPAADGPSSSESPAPPDSREMRKVTPAPNPVDSDAPVDGPDAEATTAPPPESEDVPEDPPSDDSDATSRADDGDDGSEDAPSASPIGRVPVKKVLVRRNREDSQFTIESPAEPGEFQPPNEYPGRDGGDETIGDLASEESDAASRAGNQGPDNQGPDNQTAENQGPDNGRDRNRESRLRGLLDKIKDKSSAPTPGSDDEQIDPDEATRRDPDGASEDADAASEEPDRDGNDGPASLSDRIAGAAGDLGPDQRDRLDGLDREALLEAAVVALIQKGVLPVEDILEAAVESTDENA